MFWCWVVTIRAISYITSLKCHSSCDTFFFANEHDMTECIGRMLFFHVLFFLLVNKSLILNKYISHYQIRSASPVTTDSKSLETWCIKQKEKTGNEILAGLLGVIRGLDWCQSDPAGSLPTVTIDKCMGRKWRVLIGWNNANPAKTAKLFLRKTTNGVGTGLIIQIQDWFSIFKDP